MLRITPAADFFAMKIIHRIRFRSATSSVTTPIFIYAMFEVNDDQVIYRDPELRYLDASDQIRMLLQRPDGALRHYLMVAGAPGRTSIYLVDEEWRLPLEGAASTTFIAELAATDFGYRVELRIPRSVIGAGSKLGFFVVDVDDINTREIAATLSTSPQISGDDPAQILLSSPRVNKNFTRTRSAAFTHLDLG